MTLYMLLFIHCQDEWGYTALIMACRYGHVETADLLIKKGATVNYRTKVRLMFVLLMSYSLVFPLHEAIIV